MIFFDRRPRAEAGVEPTTVTVYTLAVVATPRNKATSEGEVSSASDRRIISESIGQNLTGRCL